MQAQIAAGRVDFEIGASKLSTKFLQGPQLPFGRMLRANSPLAGLRDEIATWSGNASPPTKPRRIVPTTSLQHINAPIYSRKYPKVYLLENRGWRLFAAYTFERGRP